MDRYRSCQILVVDDNLDEVAILRRALSPHAAMSISHVARDGQEALDYLLREGEFKGKHGPSPDLILLDLNLPGISGIEVLRRVKSEESLVTIPVIMFTSSAREEDIARSYELGANTYIQKPVGYEDYAKAISLLDQYWKIAELPPVRYGLMRPPSR